MPAIVKNALKNNEKPDFHIFKKDVEIGIIRFFFY